MLAWQRRCGRRQQLLLGSEFLQALAQPFVRLRRRIAMKAT